MWDDHVFVENSESEKLTHFMGENDACGELSKPFQSDDVHSTS